MDQIDNEERHEFWLKYITLPIELFANKKIDKTDMIIFSMIDHYDEGEGKCFASNSYFSDIAGIGINSVSASISKLEEMDYIKREIQKEKGNKRILSINPQFKIIHNQHSIEINKRIQKRRSPYPSQQGYPIPVNREYI